MVRAVLVDAGPVECVCSHQIVSKSKSKLTSRFYVDIVQANDYEFHAAVLLLRLLCQQAMLHG